MVVKKDLYTFDKFVERLLNESNAYEVKIIEDYSELDASQVSDEIIENAEDTMTLVEKYIDDIETDIDKDKLKGIMRSLYVEANSLDDNI